jgi:hypothetical protein
VLYSEASMDFKIDKGADVSVVPETTFHGIGVTLETTTKTPTGLSQHSKYAGNSKAFQRMGLTKWKSKYLLCVTYQGHHWDCSTQSCTWQFLHFREFICAQFVNMKDSNRAE